MGLVWWCRIVASVWARVWGLEQLEEERAAELQESDDDAGRIELPAIHVGTTALAPMAGSLVQ
jgi:hypothetical protein